MVAHLGLPGAMTYHVDSAWTDTDDGGQTFWRPGYSYYLLSDGKPYLTYVTTAQGPRRSCPVAAHHGPHRLRPAGLGGQPSRMATEPTHG